MPGRQGDYPATLASEIDRIYRDKAKLRVKVRALEGQISEMDENMDAPLALINPSDPFDVDRKTKKTHEQVRLEVNLSGTERQVSLVFIKTEDQPPAMATPAQRKEAKGKTIVFDFPDISDDEREAKLFSRFVGPFEFLKEYGLVMIIARAVTNGFLGEAVNPPVNPFKSSPFPYLKKVSPNGTVGGDAKFTTRDSQGNANPGTSTILAPGIRGTIPTDLAFVTTFKTKGDGVKPFVNITIPSTMKELTVSIIDEQNFNPSADVPTEAIEETFQITKKERQQGSITRRFAKLLDYSTKYILIGLRGRGDNVGGADIDEVVITAQTAAGITDITTMARAEFTTPAKGASGGGVGQNTELKPDNPFVPSTLDANNLPTDYVLEAEGCFPIMHILLPRAGVDLPSTTTNVKARILPRKAFNARDLTKEETDEFEVEDEERNASPPLLKRQFTKLLRYNREYVLFQLIGEGANIGGPGIDKAKNPLGLSTPLVALASFTTPTAEGVFESSGVGALEFLGVVRRKANKKGVLITHRYGVPSGTKQLTVRIEQSTGPGTGTKFDHVFDDINSLLVNRTDSQPGKQIDLEFPHRLEPSTATVTIRYRFNRLVAQGRNINPDLTFSKDPNIVRKPISSQATGTEIGEFATAASLGFFSNDTPPVSAQVPAIPIASDITNQPLLMDKPLVAINVIASEFKGTAPPVNFPRGSGTNTAVTFGDVGADTVGVTLRQSGSTTKFDRTRSVEDISTFQQVIELDGLTFGQKYDVIAVFLAGGGDIVQAKPVNLSFRAGGEIDISLLPFITPSGTEDPPPILATSNQVQIRFTKETETEGSFEALYREPVGTSVLFRNIKFKKQILSKPGSILKEVHKEIVKEDASFFTPGLHVIPKDIKFPAASMIRLQLELEPLQGGGATVIDTMDFDTASEGGADAGFPNYINGKSIRPKLIWKPDVLKARFDLPNQNMKTFRNVRLLFLFTAKTTISIGSVYAVNPDTKEFRKFQANDIGVNGVPNGLAVPGVDDAFNLDVFVEVAQQNGGVFNFRRITDTDDGDLNITDFNDAGLRTIGQILRSATNTRSLQVFAFVYNDFTSTTAIVQAAQINLGTIFYPFIPS